MQLSLTVVFAMHVHWLRSAARNRLPISVLHLTLFSVMQVVEECNEPPHTWPKASQEPDTTQAAKPPGTLSGHNLASTVPQALKPGLSLGDAVGHVTNEEVVRRMAAVLRMSPARLQAALPHVTAPTTPAADPQAEVVARLDRVQQQLADLQAAVLAVSPPPAEPQPPQPDVAVIGALQNLEQMVLEIDDRLYSIHDALLKEEDVNSAPAVEPALAQATDRISAVLAGVTEAAERLRDEVTHVAVDVSNLDEKLEELLTAPNKPPAATAPLPQAADEAAASAAQVEELHDKLDKLRLHLDSKLDSTLDKLPGHLDSKLSSMHEGLSEDVSVAASDVADSVQHAINVLRTSVGDVSQTLVRMEDQQETEWAAAFDSLGDLRHYVEKLDISLVTELHDVEQAIHSASSNDVSQQATLDQIQTTLSSLVSSLATSPDAQQATLDQIQTTLSSLVSSLATSPDPQQATMDRIQTTLSDLVSSLATSPDAQQATLEQFLTTLSSLVSSLSTSPNAEQPTEFPPFLEQPAAETEAAVDSEQPTADTADPAWLTEQATAADQFHVQALQAGLAAGRQQGFKGLPPDYSKLIEAVEARRKARSIPVEEDNGTTDEDEDLGAASDYESDGYPVEEDNATTEEDEYIGAESDDESDGYRYSRGQLSDLDDDYASGEEGESDESAYAGPDADDSEADSDSRYLQRSDSEAESDDVIAQADAADASRQAESDYGSHDVSPDHDPATALDAAEKYGQSDYGSGEFDPDADLMTALQAVEAEAVSFSNSLEEVAADDSSTIALKAGKHEDPVPDSAAADSDSDTEMGKDSSEDGPKELAYHEFDARQYMGVPAFKNYIPHPAAVAFPAQLPSGPLEAVVIATEAAALVLETALVSQLSLRAVYLCCRRHCRVLKEGCWNGRAACLLPLWYPWQSKALLKMCPTAPSP